MTGVKIEQKKSMSFLESTCSHTCIQLASNIEQTMFTTDELHIIDRGKGAAGWSVKEGNKLGPLHYDLGL